MLNGKEFEDHCKRELSCEQKQTLVALEQTAKDVIAAMICIDKGMRPGSMLTLALMRLGEVSKYIMYGDEQSAEYATADRNDLVKEINANPEGRLVKSFGSANAAAKHIVRLMTSTNGSTEVPNTRVAQGVRHDN